MTCLQRAALFGLLGWPLRLPRATSSANRAEAAKAPNPVDICCSILRRVCKPCVKAEREWNDELIGCRRIHSSPGGRDIGRAKSRVRARPTGEWSRICLKLPSKGVSRSGSAFSKRLRETRFRSSLLQRALLLPAIAAPMLEPEGGQIHRLKGPRIAPEHW